MGLIFYQLITGQPFFQMDNDELDSLEEQGVYVDPGRMQCDAYYVQLRLSIAKRFANSAPAGGVAMWVRGCDGGWDDRASSKNQEVEMT